MIAFMEELGYRLGRIHADLEPKGLRRFDLTDAGRDAADQVADHPAPDEHPPTTDTDYYAEVTR